MRFAHIYSRLISTPWFVSQTTLEGIAKLLESRINGVSFAGQPAGNKPISVSSPEEIAVIPVSGVLGKHLSDMETMCGGCDMDAIREQFDNAMGSAKVKAAVLYIDSPGGMAIGCHELFTYMFNAKTKPLYAYSDVICGSAAYYLACAADMIFCAPTAQVGSIGSMMMLADETKRAEMQGVKFTILRSGEFKGLGSSVEKTSEAGMAALQNMVDTLGAQFRSDVSLARPGIAAADMQGLAYDGRQAVEKKLADQTLNDLHDLFHLLLK